MTERTLLWVDAFTNRPLAGNPFAVVLDADGLEDDEMPALAREMNLSEAAFVLNSRRADMGARYFTPGGEIPLAGHPTIATAVALLDQGRLSLREPVDSFSLELPAGVIQVEVESGTGPPLVTMDQLKPRFMRRYDPETLAPVFGLSPRDFLPGAQPQTVSTGTPMLMVPLASRDHLRKVEADLPSLARLMEAGDFFSVHLFCMEGTSDEGSTFARHLGLPPDTLEDPFTGSATGCMGAFIWKHGLLKEPRFTAEQGHWMGRPGQARVEVLGPRENPDGVRVGGSGVAVVRRKLVLRLKAKISVSLQITRSDLDFSYSGAHEVLREVNLVLTPGWTGVVGGNGSGKTTLIRLLAGELDPTPHPVRRIPGTQVIRYCPQRVGAITPGIRALAHPSDGRAHRLMGLLELDSDAPARWTSLSPGERKRWQIAAALVDHPDLLLLDEPTNHLDLPSIERLEKALGEYSAALLMVSHDGRFAEALIREWWRIEEGRVVQGGG